MKILCALEAAGALAGSPLTLAVTLDCSTPLNPS
jgi:hypothetical protein